MEGAPPAKIEAEPPLRGRLTVDLRVPLGTAVPTVARFVKLCEQVGFAGVGIHDHPHSGRDAYVALALAAAATERIRLYPATSNPVTRHPALLASSIASLAEAAPHRVLLTLGVGFLGVRTLGLRRAAVDEMRTAVEQVRKLVRGEEVNFRGASVKLRMPPEIPPPVYILASGPRMIELAGEVADGAVIMVGLDPASNSAAQEHLAAGAKRGGRSLTGFDVIHVVPTAVGARHQVTRWIQSEFAPGQPWLSVPSRWNAYWLRHAGIPVADDIRPTEISDELAARISDAFGLFGPPEHCAERLIRATEESDIRHVFISVNHNQQTSYDMPERELKAFAQVILPRLRSPGNARHDGKARPGPQEVEA